MTKTPRYILLIFGIFVLAAFLLIEARRGSQYRLGMTIAEVRSKVGGQYPTRKFGLEYDSKPTAQQMNEDALYYIYDESTGILLMFNHHERLIEKKRTKWFGLNIIKITDSFRQ